MDIQRRGKVLFIELSGNPERTLALHLRMSGRLELAPTSQPRNSWTHALWRLSGGSELRFIDPRKFGLMWYGKPEEISRDPYLVHLGPDPHTLNLREFMRILRQGKGMIKSFLLRQDRFAGIGNIIADEALWRARIHPRALIQDLDGADIQKLRDALKSTIHSMLRFGGTTMRSWGQPDGRRGEYYERRKVYGRAKESCRRCRAKLVKIKAAGRGTTVCQRCQRLA